MPNFESPKEPLADFMKKWRRRDPEFKNQLMGYLLQDEKGEKSRYLTTAITEFEAEKLPDTHQRLGGYLYWLVRLGVRGEDFDVMYEQVFKRDAARMFFKVANTTAFPVGDTNEILEEIEKAKQDPAYISPLAKRPSNETHVINPVPRARQPVEARPSPAFDLGAYLRKTFRFK